MEEDSMSYYNTPEQRIDPPEMSAAQESLLEEADDIVSKIDKLRDKAESFFEELTIFQLEDILGDIEYLKDELESLATDDNILEDEIWSARRAFEDVEGWMHEKEDLIKTEGDK
jgi:prefoldin subunit 5